MTKPLTQAYTKYLDDIEKDTSNLIAITSNSVFNTIEITSNLLAEYIMSVDDNSIQNTFKQLTYPGKQLNGKEILQPLEHLDVYVTNCGSFQQLGYNYIIENMRNMSTIKSLHVFMCSLRGRTNAAT